MLFDENVCWYHPSHWTKSNTSTLFFAWLIQFVIVIPRVIELSAVSDLSALRDATWGRFLNEYLVTSSRGQVFLPLHESRFVLCRIVGLFGMAWFWRWMALCRRLLLTEYVNRAFFSDYSFCSMRLINLLSHLLTFACTWWGILSKLRSPWVIPGAEETKWRCSCNLELDSQD